MGYTVPTLRGSYTKPTPRLCEWYEKPLRVFMRRGKEAVCRNCYAPAPPPPPIQETEVQK